MTRERDTRIKVHDDEMDAERVAHSSTRAFERAMVKPKIRAKTARAARRRAGDKDAREGGRDDVAGGAVERDARPLARSLERKAAKRARFLSSACARVIVSVDARAVDGRWSVQDAEGLTRTRARTQS